MSGTRGTRPSSAMRTSMSGALISKKSLVILAIGGGPQVSTRSPEPTGPRKEQKIAIVRIVVGVVVRHEDVPHLGQRHAGQYELARHAVRTVDDVGHVVRNDDLRGRHAALAGARPAAGAEQDQAGLRAGSAVAYLRVGTAANRNGRCRDRCARAVQQSPSRPHRAPPSHEVRKNKVRPVAAGSILRGAARGNEGDPAHASPTEPAARPGGPREAAEPPPP